MTSKTSSKTSMTVAELRAAGHDITFMFKQFAGGLDFECLVHAYSINAGWMLGTVAAFRHEQDVSSADPEVINTVTLYIGGGFHHALDLADLTNTIASLADDVVPVADVDFKDFAAARNHFGFTNA